MPAFTENDLRYSYQWNSNTIAKLPKKLRFKDDLELNLEDGYEVLIFINSYMELRNLGMKCTFQKIEYALQEELPTTTRSLNKIKRFLTENYFF